MNRRKTSADLVAEAKFQELPGEVTENRLAPLIQRLTQQAATTPHDAMLQYYLAKSHEYTKCLGRFESQALAITARPLSFPGELFRSLARS